MRIVLGFIIGLVLAIAIAATAFKVAWGDFGDFDKRDRGGDVAMTIAAADFDRIDVAGVFEFDVTVGGDYSVVLSGAEEDLARTSAEVRDGALFLDSKSTAIEGRRKFVNHSVTATITLPMLLGVDASGVVDGDIVNIDSETFDADLSGVGELKLSGRCGALDAEVSGVGELDATKLQCRSVNVGVSGVGEAQVSSPIVMGQIHIEFPGLAGAFRGTDAA